METTRCQAPQEPPGQPEPQVRVRRAPPARGHRVPPAGASGAGAPGAAAAAPAGQAPQGAQGGGRQGGRGGRGSADRVNWDAPYIISPHSPRRLYWATNFVYRTDDRGDSWTRISPDLSRNLNRDELPIMGKLWPADSIARNTSTTPLSNVVSIDESPLLEGLLYVGTDDGLIQVTEDGGKNWRKIEQFPGVPQWTYVTDVFASPREADTVFATLNNWQRGDYKPYVVKSTDRGRTWTNISSDLPPKHDVWSIIQDHVNGNLLFAGTEFGVFTSVDGGQHWIQLKGGMPPAQVRDMTVQKRENDLVLATFGRGFYVLDDYSALRDITPATLNEDARLFPLRDAVLFNLLGLAPAGSAGLSPLSGLWRAENPPFGAVFTYHVRQELPADAKLVLTISDDGGRPIRRMDIDKGAGLRRVAWNLRMDPPAPPAPGSPEAAAAAGRGGQAGRGGFGGGRGGNQGALVPAGPLQSDARPHGRRHRHAHRRAAVVRRGADPAVTATVGRQRATGHKRPIHGAPRLARVTDRHSGQDQCCPCHPWPVLFMRILNGFVLSAGGFALSVVACTAFAVAQSRDPIRVATRLVQIHVIVQDKDRNPVRDLTRADFRLTEDGREQAIQFFEVESVAASAAMPVVPPNRTRSRTSSRRRAAASR